MCAFYIIGHPCHGTWEVSLMLSTSQSESSNSNMKLDSNIDRSIGSMEGDLISLVGLLHLGDDSTLIQ